MFSAVPRDCRLQLGDDPRHLLVLTMMTATSDINNYYQCYWYAVWQFNGGTPCQCCKSSAHTEVLLGISQSICRVAPILLHCTNVHVASWYAHTLCLQKNDTITHYNFNAYLLILLIFDRDVAGRVYQQMVICYPPLLTNVSVLPEETWTPKIGYFQSCCIPKTITSLFNFSCPFAIISLICCEIIMVSIQSASSPAEAGM